MRRALAPAAAQAGRQAGGRTGWAAGARQGPVHLVSPGHSCSSAFPIDLRRSPCHFGAASPDQSRWQCSTAGLGEQEAFLCPRTSSVPSTRPLMMAVGSVKVLPPSLCSGGRAHVQCGCRSMCSAGYSFPAHSSQPRAEPPPCSLVQPLPAVAAATALHAPGQELAETRERAAHRVPVAAQPELALVRGQQRLCHKPRLDQRHAAAGAGAAAAAGWSAAAGAAASAAAAALRRLGVSAVAAATAQPAARPQAGRAVHSSGAAVEAVPVLHPAPPLPSLRPGCSPPLRLAPRLLQAPPRAGGARLSGVRRS